MAFINYLRKVRNYSATFLGGAAVGTYLYIAIEDFIPRKYKRKIQIEFEEKNIDDELKKRSDEIFRFGKPQMGSELFYYKNHVLSFNQERKILRWAMEHLARKHVTGNASRHHVRYMPDPQIPYAFTAQPSDYKDTAWARGRMVPAGDNKYNQQAMDSTFLFSNVVPQDPDTNSGYWNRLEIFCRTLLDSYEDIYIITGPMFIPKEEGNSERRFIRHYVIGQNDVHVPTHIFKIILCDKGDGSNPVLGAFVLPNQRIIGDPPLQQFDVGLEYIEHHTGLTLLSKIDRDHVRNLCHVMDCELIDRDTFEMHMVERKIEGATSVRMLNEAWFELKRKNVRPTDELKNMYRDKRKELELRQTVIQSGGEN